MNRRRFLAAGGVAGTIAVAGCLDLILADNPTVPDEMSVTTRHTNRRVLQERVLWRSDNGTINSYHLLISDPSAAQERIGPEDVSPDPRDISFIENTDFDQSYIVIVKTGLTSNGSMELRKIERIDGGIRVSVEADPGRNGDRTEHALLIRITDDDAGVPGEVVAEVDGEPTDMGEVAGG